MRSSSIALAATAFMLACADAPTSPLLEPATPSFDGKAPPPWALISGEITTDGDGALLSALSLSRSADGPAVMSHAGGNTATYRAWLLVTPGDHVALLRFIDGTNVTFSNGAMLSNVNSKVSGRGTMTVGGHTYALSAVTSFTADDDCVTTGPYTGPGCVTFSAGDGSFSSTGVSTWTGVLSNDGGGGRDFDFPPGWGDCRFFDCACIDCVITTDVKGKGR